MTSTPGDQPEQPDQPTAPYQQPYPEQEYPAAGYPPWYAADHPRATTSLVLGVLGIVACQVLGPVAWWMGKKTLDEIDASGGRYGGRAAAQAGYVMGIVGTVLLTLALVVLVFYALVFVALIAATMTGIG